ncbi:MAG: hypothetical protein EOP49_06200 [Sphingobacteriales bacterium]|nr:MAG: hypothetical protein EOP49_06200 [Sphingobacteriales bacterium]
MQVNKVRADFGELCVTTTNELSIESEITPASARALRENPSVCASGKWDAIAGTFATGVIKAAPLSLLRNWFKPEVMLAGVIDGQMIFKAPKSAPATLDANIQTRDGKLIYQFQGGKVETYPLRQATANASLKNNIFNASLIMDWDKYGTINADGKYTLTDKKIQAKASTALPNLAPLEGLLPMLNNVVGSANGNVNVAGTLDKPEVTGRFELTGGSANLPKLGLELKNVSFLITSPSVNSAHVEGKITSGDGTLVTQGNFTNIGSPDWHWQANVFGANIRIIQQSQLTANISPNLKVNASSKAIELTGSTEIPWARANVKNLPESATRVSSDVVIVKNNSALEAVAKKSIPSATRQGKVGNRLLITRRATSIT